MLGIGRSIGETAAVIFTAGSSLRLPNSIFDSTRTMAVHFYILAHEGISNENAYGTAATLIIAVLLVNITAYWLMHLFISKRLKPMMNIKFDIRELNVFSRRNGFAKYRFAGSRK